MGPQRQNKAGNFTVFLLCLAGLAACAPTPVPVQASEEAIESVIEAVQVSTTATETVEKPVARASERACFQLLSPELGEEIPNIGLVVFEWNEKVGASSYQVQMELPNGNAEYFNSDEPSLDKYMASLPLEGSYSWRVLAFDSGGEPICFSDRFEFSKAEYEFEP
jgi:hypothetical protein